MEERAQEIAIEYLEHYKKVKCGVMPEWVWDMAIKALEQEPILDKIRAEIERRGGNDEKAFCKSLNESYKLGLREAIDIIDKYKAESEDT